MMFELLELARQAFLAHPSAETSKVYRAVAIAASKELELDWAPIDEATQPYWSLMPSYSLG
jgi:hypothetical protein